jgi:hypothetical protein
MNAARRQILWQGLVAGLIGYATVALVIAAANLVSGRSPFHTAALLGGALFYGLTDAASVRIWPGAVLAYNGLHLVVFLVFGTIAAAFASLSDRGPHLWYVGAVMMLFIMFHMIGLFLFVTEAVRAALVLWVLVAASFAALVTMAAYLVWAHPDLRREFRDFAAHDDDLADSDRG